MSTAIMQTGAMGWDYKFHDWNDSNDVGDIQLKVSNKIHFQFNPKPIQTKSQSQVCVVSRSFVWVFLFLFIKLWKTSFVTVVCDLGL